MDAPTSVNRTTPKRQAPPLRRIGTLPARIGTVPGQRSRVGVAAPGQRRPGALQQVRDSPTAGTRVGPAAPRLAAPALAAPALALPRGGTGTPPRRRPGGIAPAGAAAAPLLGALSADRSAALPPSAGTPERPGAADDTMDDTMSGLLGHQEEQLDDDDDDGAAEATPLMLSNGEELEEDLDLEQEQEEQEQEDAPRVRIRSAVILRPILEGDHIEYEIETLYSLGSSASEGEGEGDAAAGENASAPVVFVPCAAFDGAREGYEFKNGALGVGYYRTEPEPEPEPEPGGGEDAVLRSVVMRRFSKFDTLRKLIIKKFPDLPKLPKKGFRRHGGVDHLAEQERSGGGSSSDPRIAGLNAFLAAVLGTEGSSDEEHVQQFLGVSELDRLTAAEMHADEMQDQQDGAYLGLRRGSAQHHWGSAQKVVTIGKLGRALSENATAASAAAAAAGGEQAGLMGRQSIAGSSYGNGGNSVFDLRASSVNLFDSDGGSMRRSASYVPREQRNLGQHAVHSVGKKATRRIEGVGMARRNAPPSVPRRVRDMLGVDETALGVDGSFQHVHRATSARHLADALQAQRMSVSEDANAEVVKVVDLWSCYVKLERDVEGHFWTFALYVAYWMLLMMTFFDGPSSSWSLAQSEAIDDLLFDEEFESANYKKNWHEVMTEEELYTWIEGPLTNALYDTETGTNSSLLGGTTHLVGQVEFRQARSTAGSGDTTACDDGGGGGGGNFNCPTEFGDMTVDGSLIGGGRCSGSWHIPQFESFYSDKVDWSEPIYRPCPDGGDDNQDDEDGDQYEEAEAAAARYGNFTWRKHSWALEGSKAFVRKAMGDMNPFSGNPWDYGNGGYSTTWPRDYSLWREQLRAMRGGSDGGGNGEEGEGGGEAVQPLIDRHTRALAITMVLYNGNSFAYSKVNSTDRAQHKDGFQDIVNSDQLLFVQAVVEIDPGGHYEKHTKVLAMRPMRDYSDPELKGVGLLRRLTHQLFGRLLWREDVYGQAFVVLALLLFLVELRKLVWVEGFRSFLIVSSSAAWNKFEVWVWFMLFLTLLASSWFREASNDALTALAEVETSALGGGGAAAMAVDGGSDAAHRLVDVVAELRFSQIRLRRCVAWLLFFSTLKVMKFMNLSERLSFLWRVLGHAKVELMAFLVLFLVLLLSFSLLASVMMGYHARELHNIPTAALSLLRLTVGIFDFNYGEWQEADPLWAPVFIVTFIFLLILVAANIFIAILTDAYSTKKAQIVKYTRFKKLLRKEGVLLTSASAAGLLKRLYRTFFPHWRLQVPPQLWPRPGNVGVEPTYKLHQSGFDGGADLVTLHFHHESMVGSAATLASVGSIGGRRTNSNTGDGDDDSGGGGEGKGKGKDKEEEKGAAQERRRTMVAQKQVGITLASAVEELEDEDEQEAANPLHARNALNGSDRACYLQLAQDLHMEDLPILITLMRKGEFVELKGTGHSSAVRIT